MRRERLSARAGCVIEGLEARQLLSAAPVERLVAMTPRLTTPITIVTKPSVVLHEQAGVSFTANLGSFVTLAPATNLQANIRWGDGTTSKGTLVPSGVVGIDEVKFEVDGTHTYRKAGKYRITVVVTQPGPTPTTVIRLITTLHDRAVVTAQKTTVLNGTITGKYSLAPTAADIGAGYVFDGTGTAGVLGAVSAHGFVTLPGFIVSGQASGTLTLTQTGPSASAVNNSVTLKLTGPTEAGFGPFPSTLSYTVTSGTGAFAGATGSGTIGVTLGSGMTFTFVITSLVTPTPVI